MSMPTPPPAPPTPQPKASRLPWIIVACLAVLLVAGAVVGLVALNRPAKAASGAVTTPVEEHLASEPEIGLPDPVEPTAAGPTVGVSDMALSLKTTAKHCFGSAGCNLTVQVNAKRKAGVEKPDPDDVWVVTYQINGGEDGPVIGSFQITDGQYEINEEDISTTSSNKKLTIKVTDVEQVGE